MEICKKTLDANIGNQYISDFSFHSIGVILFKNNKENIFQKFSIDVIPKIKIITLSKEFYKDLADVKQNVGLDFDDAYQFKVAKEHGLEIITMDKAFINKVNEKIKITNIEKLIQHFYEADL